MKNLIETLRNQAVEIAKEGHAGWGNTMSCAADEIEKLDAEGVRGRKAREAMGKLEWSAVHDYSTGWPCCPICRGIKPGHGKDHKGNIPISSGHREYCYFYKQSEGVEG